MGTANFWITLESVLRTFLPLIWDVVPLVPLCIPKVATTQLQSIGAHKVPLLLSRTKATAVHAGRSLPQAPLKAPTTSSTMIFNPSRSRTWLVVIIPIWVATADGWMMPSNGLRAMVVSALKMLILTPQAPLE